MRLDNLYYLDTCRDPNCDRDDIHRPHPIRSRPYRPTVVEISKRSILADITLDAISLRVPKTFGQIYVDVVDDYGSITQRNVYKTLASLVDARDVACIVPAGLQGKVAKNGIRSVYLRYDSPILWQRDGLRDVMEIARDMINEDQSIGVAA